MSIIPPNLRRPTEGDVRELARAHHFEFDEEELAIVCEYIDDALEGYESLETEHREGEGRQIGGRNPGYRPTRDEDPLNAFSRKCRVVGRDTGPLAGATVGVKDIVSVAGIENTGGSRLLAGFVPTEDAPVVTRLLEAGATIVGKTTSDDLAVVGTGGTPATGVVRNPHDDDYLAGGSSAGSAAAVVNGDVDIAVGTDTGGSIRIPASWSGCVGLKPTYDRVPFEGILHLAPSLDHVGPLARTVEDCARAFAVMADESPEFIAEFGGTEELTIGLVTESLAFDDVEDDVAATVCDAAETVDETRANVGDVSIPKHREGLAVHGAITTYEITRMVSSDGMAHSRRRRFDPKLVRSFGDARRARGGDLNFRMKAVLVLGEYLSREYAGVHYAMAGNMRDSFEEAYDEVLAEYDVLALPATPTTALPVDVEDTKEAMLLEHTSNPNTAQFNFTGHPAITLPCGTSDGLPVGLMLVGQKGDDETVLRAAHTVERALEGAG